jgi:valyl-tRNA synthetase
MVAVALLSSTAAKVGAFTAPSLRRSAVKSFSKRNTGFSQKLSFLNKHGTSALLSTAASVESKSSAVSGQSGIDSLYDVSNKEKGIVGKYEPQLFESEIYQWWEAAGCFQPDAKQTKEEAQNKGREPYVLPMPPPNVTGRLHMGHAMFVALQDALARFHRMRGRPVLWTPGKECKDHCFCVCSNLTVISRT